MQRKALFRAVARAQSAFNMDSSAANEEALESLRGQVQMGSHSGGGFGQPQQFGAPQQFGQPQAGFGQPPSGLGQPQASAGKGGILDTLKGLSSFNQNGNQSSVSSFDLKHGAPSNLPSLQLFGPQNQELPNLGGQFNQNQRRF